MQHFYHFINRTPERAGRTYSIWLQRDLFGNWTLMRMNGGRQREPVLHSQVVASREEGERLMGQILKVRLRHGYVETAGGNATIPTHSDRP